MAEIPTILVVDSDDTRRRKLGLALYEGGNEVINAVNGEEAIRFTAGLNPTLVLVHTGLEGGEPLELHRRLKATGLDLPPFLVLHSGDLRVPDDVPESGLYVLPSVDMSPERLLHQVRLLLLARDMGGELSDGIDKLRGDLTRISIGDLLRVLQSHIITGQVSFSARDDVGIWLQDGEVVNARWGSISGRKAFNRIASLRGGAFVITLDLPAGERTIDQDLASLVTDAVEEKLQLDELFRRLPGLKARVDIKMGDRFFSVEYSPTERAVLQYIREARNFAELIDLVPEPDLEVVRAIVRLRDQEILQFVEPQQQLHIVTDSTADILPSEARRHGITVVPLTVLFESQVFKDGIDLVPDQFYRRLVASQKLPTTSPPSVGEFVGAYEQLIGSGDIISIHISGKLSETVRRARDAVARGADGYQRLREEAGLPTLPIIRVVDSWQISVGLALQVHIARQMVELGLSADEIVRRLEDQRKRYHMLFSVDTLEYLQKGRRIHKAQALLGTLLEIKPILGLKDGDVVPTDRVRGGHNVIPKLVSLFSERVDPERPVFVAVGHASAPRWGSRLKEAIVEAFEVVELHEGEIGPIVGTHVGPGTIGACFFQPTVEELEILQRGK